ncbi:MAG: SGNH/GDSL hydrolase family protein [Candidatus Eremiobacteraeota bacterium]|nr:SGNH/GDSL hydrolase family protein [Candidatus Eremiobacteraeota bacterium]
MKINHLQRALALVAMAALAACGGGGSSPSTIPAPSPAASPNILSVIVGVGDSLTAGYQSSGWLGATNVPNPLLTGTPYAGAPAPFGQENGWWSLLYQQAQTAYTGTPFSPLAMAAPTSPLPLIAGPGIGNELVPANPALTGGLSFGPLYGTAPGAGCKANDQAAYSLSTVATTLVNPRSMPLDLGIPGLTIHEEIAMHQPLVPSCASIPGIPASIQGVVGGESEDFWPVLQNFANLGSSLTPLSAAVSLKPTLATVWLGANDLLKYGFSAGQWQGDDTSVAQVQSDITTIINQLKGSGAKVVVANIPDILVAPQFFTVQDPTVLAGQLAPTLQPSVCDIQANAACTIELFATSQNPALPISLSEAQSLVVAVSNAYGLGATTSTPGYLTETGMLTTIETLGAVIKAQPALLGNPTALATALTGALQLDPSGAGTGLGGNYFTPAWAAQVQTVNNNINNGILAAAQATNTPLVDVKTLEDNLSWEGAIGASPNPFFLQALSINPGKCCTLGFGGGILSFDGLHPSDTGYALIANAFIQTINTAYGTTINQVSPINVYNGTGYFYPDPFAQH